nr:T-lymphoma invasion and metastasis-inducing protein 1-like isoform X2 [Paramormyrops kingsleyae]XP_023681905.1 T-lymphoma invasion and metastasis-inducing protein 1-like isoform X2 [Paramormyrops kingsleyae]XP_023681906.1 T-lymphoma invasion and metastasis-inducing protein 1-like isoform X2 [Paramormyrops kingsleyae]
MGNLESQRWDRLFYRDGPGYLCHSSRKEMSQSLRVTGKQTRCSQYMSSGKVEHRSSETSTRSSSTPSIPQSLTDNGLKAFNEAGALPDFGSPIWVDRVAMSLRPRSFHNDLSLSLMDPHKSQVVPPGKRRSKAYAGGSILLQKVRVGPWKRARHRKKRSKSAEMHRDDSLDISISDLSSTEEIAEGDCHGNCGKLDLLDINNRSNSMEEFYAQGSRSHTLLRYFVKHWPRSEKTTLEGGSSEASSPFEEDRSAFGAYTLPCRHSHCLSEGLPSHQGALCERLQARRVLTTQDVTAGDSSEYGDSGIDGVLADTERRSRRYKTTSASFSLCSAAARSLFTGGDKAATQGVYENFQLELERSTFHAVECPVEVGSSPSDERSDGIRGCCAYPSDPTLGSAHSMVRKAGALSVKNFLVNKKNKKVEPAGRRRWRRYWVSLKEDVVLLLSSGCDLQHVLGWFVAVCEAARTRISISKSEAMVLDRKRLDCHLLVVGCTLFFYETDGRSGIDHNSIPKHAAFVENSIVQAVPEHPKKDFVFCLSNSQGDAFLFQTSSQTELENWMTAIHSSCAAALARQQRWDDTVRLLRFEIRKLEQKIDMDEKMKKMADMQLSTVPDSKKRKTILEQIFLWEQNLEKFHMDLFRFRCYLASLQGGEPPNPKRLLAVASRSTKIAMGRLGIFSVSSFHALVAARTETGVRQQTKVMSRTSSKHKSRFSSLWGLDTMSKKKTKDRPSISQVFADGRELAKELPDGTLVLGAKERAKMEIEGPPKDIPKHLTDGDVWDSSSLIPSWVSLPSDRPVLAVIRPGESTLHVLEIICKAHHLDPSKHYLRLKFLINEQVQFYVPEPEEELKDLQYKEVQICLRITKVISFSRRNSYMIGYGFSVSMVDENNMQKLYVTSVKAGNSAFAKGLRVGDEVLQINGRDPSCMTFSEMKTVFSQASLTLTVSTLPTVHRNQLCYLPPRHSDGVKDLHTDIFSQNQEDILDNGVYLDLGSPCDCIHGDTESFSDLMEGLKSTEQVAAFCRSLHDMNPSEGSSSPSPDSPLPPTATQRQLSDADKLRKVVSELVETERTYVKDLNCLIEKYLTPLQQEKFLTQDELDVLFGNLVEMVEFQVEFLKTLEDGTRLVPDLEKLERVDQFKKVLFSLGGSFLYYADRFKIYSAFCASHTKVPKVLVKAKTDPDFKAFLDARNPRQQHSSTLESYLIKPIQRVLKYPLLLKELYSLTDPDSEEHYHLDVAMKAMNKVASHINEMQKIHEEYGAVFDQLITDQAADKKEVADLSMGDLLLHSTVAWINPPASLGKWKKDPELATFVFRTAVVFVHKDCSKPKKKIGGAHRGSTPDEKDHFRYRHMIPTDALQIRSLANSEGTAVCEIVHVKSESEGRPERTFQLSCRSPESKKDLLKMVHSVLRDKQRRQLLKTESLPLSQQYVPFGGKRLCALKGARPAMNRAVSAPTRTLGRRKLVRNRFTIDTDMVYDGGPDSDLSTEPATPGTPGTPETPDGPGELVHGDTDRWVEEQFDLDRYEQEQEEVKETDILSDEDEYYTLARGASSETDLEVPLRAFSLGDAAWHEGEDEGEAGDPGLLKDPATDQPEKTPECTQDPGAQNRRTSEEVIWLRRDDSEGRVDT